MQDDRGLNSILTASRMYEVFQDFVGARRSRRWLAERYWCLNGGEKVVDIGCGPGVILDYLARDVDYVGFDISSNYIESARNRHGSRGTFLVGSTREFRAAPDPRLQNAQLVLCNGLLHHLDNGDAIDVLEFSNEILADDGRLVCCEPVFLAHQSRLSRWLLRRDRGKNIRTEQEWKSLFGQVFHSFETAIATNLLRIPYIHLIAVCRKLPPAP
jgi:SAM-dependent methyltransferase